jgi:hypothetical protein
MTPQEQAAHVIEAAARARCLDHWSTTNDPPCHPSDEGWNGCHLCVNRAGNATAIRAAVELVLPEEICPTWDGSGDDAGIDELTSRMIKRAELLAIADALEAPHR